MIVINAGDVYVRQRFTMAHEFKHVLDSPTQAIMFARVREPSLVRERVADHFAACLLMPKVWVVRAWTHGIQDIGTTGPDVRGLRVRHELAAARAGTDWTGRALQPDSKPATEKCA